MARRRLEGLQRVLGVNALFSTAYGNVGSSIYYALGLVASFALGLTPVVFIITGFIFWLTAATYSEAAALNILLAVTDFMTQLLLVVVGCVLVLSPDTLVDNVQLGTAPTWHDFLIAIPIGMIAYTGIETISNMAEEARDQEKTIPAAINRVVVAVFAIYALLPAVALSALPVTCSNGKCQTLLG